MRSSVKEIKMGALYRWAALYHIERPETERMLVARCGMGRDKAAQLAGHWYTTVKLRRTP